VAPQVAAKGRCTGGRGLCTRVRYSASARPLHHVYIGCACVQRQRRRQLVQLSQLVAGVRMRRALRPLVLRCICSADSAVLPQKVPWKLHACTHSKNEHTHSRTQTVHTRTRTHAYTHSTRTHAPTHTHTHAHTHSCAHTRHATLMPSCSPRPPCKPDQSTLAPKALLLGLTVLCAHTQAYEAGAMCAACACLQVKAGRGLYKAEVV